MKNHFKLLHSEDQPTLNFDSQCSSKNKVGCIKGAQGKDNGWTLTWSELSVYIPSEEQRWTRSRTSYKRIINNVSGAVLPGSLVAILGPSGAGKSTMLSAISHRYYGNTMVDGDIRLNGKKVDESMRYLSGYMYQEDIFLGTLTVKEHLNFMARLKMDRRTTRFTRESTINLLIEQLGLSNVANCKIGGLAVDGEKKLLSGGEKKRLSFAAACLTSPKLLFADEPTTGLDSYSAGRLIALMRAKVYLDGASLVCTIHQPSAEVLAMFNLIYILAEGMLVFAGSTEEAVSFFQSCGHSREKQMTHGEFLVRCVAPIPGAENATKVAIRRYVNEYAISDHYRNIETTVLFQKEIGEIFFYRSPDYRPAFWFSKLYLLCVRSCLENFRNPNLVWVKIFQKLILGVIAGLCYFGTAQLDQGGIQAVQGALFIIVSENTFFPMYAALSSIPQDFPLFIREHSNGAYDSLAYYISKIICSFPWLGIESAFFTSCVYCLAGLNSSWYAFCMINFLSVLCINVSVSCGTLFSTAFGSVPLAMAYLVPFDYIAMITSGVFIKLSTMPVVTIWMQYLSWMMYTYESLSIVQWEPITNISCIESNPSLPCFKSGEDVLENYSFSVANLNRNIIALIVLYFCFHILGFLCFIRKIKKKF